MGIKSNINVTAARKRLKDTGVEVMRDSAAACQEVAQEKARVRSGTMRRKIILVLTPEGARVEAQDPITALHEYGTGQKGERPGRQTPWVYYDETLNQFFTTTGVTPQPMMRPGYREGVEEFKRQKRRRGL